MRGLYAPSLSSEQKHIRIEVMLSVIISELLHVDPKPPCTTAIHDETPARFAQNVALKNGQARFPQNHSQNRGRSPRFTSKVETGSRMKPFETPGSILWESLVDYFNGSKIETLAPFDDGSAIRPDNDFPDISEGRDLSIRIPGEQASVHGRINAQSN